MAISKQRLEELIEQGATIWHDDFGEIKLNKNTCEVCDVKGWSTGEHIYWALYFEYKYNNETYHHDINIDDLEEDVENGREQLEFGNITRTERLELPSWEDFKKTHVFLFESKEKVLMELAVWECKDNRLIKVTTANDWKVCFFNKPLTRENYDDARRLCVKLFKGENIDG